MNKLFNAMLCVVIQGVFFGGVYAMEKTACSAAAEPSARIVEDFFDAVSNGKYDIVKNLLDHYRIDVNAQDEDYGLTPLIHAAMRKNCAFVELLIERGALVNMPEEGGLTPLMFASRMSTDDMIRILIASGANVNQQSAHDYTALMEAARRGNTEIVRTLLAAGAQIDAVDERGATALFGAASEGKYRVVQMLLEHGANLWMTNNQGQTPLISAIINGQEEVVPVLLASCCHNARRDVLTTLLGCEDLCAPDSPEKDFPPEHTRGILQRLYVESYVNARDNEGHTALWYLQQDASANPEIVKMLLDAGAQE